ncbi:hypothetical protein [Arthrobacter sp. CAN_A1]|uniref:hypothetical protein n=1 Tax=Arthrobacter sp. CAN_A1 TaxID=2787717 RepID=UPI0018CA84D2
MMEWGYEKQDSFFYWNGILSRFGRGIRLDERVCGYRCGHLGGGFQRVLGRDAGRNFWWDV